MFACFVRDVGGHQGGDKCAGVHGDCRQVSLGATVIYPLDDCRPEAAQSRQGELVGTEHDQIRIEGRFSKGQGHLIPFEGCVWSVVGSPRSNSAQSFPIGRESPFHSLGHGRESNKDDHADADGDDPFDQGYPLPGPIFSVIAKSHFNTVR